MEDPVFYRTDVVEDYQNKKREAEQGQCRLHLQQQEAQEKQVATLTVISELIQNNFTKYIRFDFSFSWTRSMQRFQIAVEALCM